MSNLKANVQNALDHMEEHPRKHIRVRIATGRGLISLLDGSTLPLKTALLAEFEGELPIYMYEFNPEKHIGTEHNIVLGMRKGKGIVCLAGRNDVEYQSCVQCAQQKIDDEDSVPNSPPPLEKYFFGIFTTDIYTIIIAASSQIPQAFHCEIVRGTGQPDLQSVISRLLLLGASRKCKVENVEEA